MPPRRRVRCRDRLRSRRDLCGSHAACLARARGHSTARGSTGAILKTMSMSCSMKTTVIFCALPELADLLDHRASALPVPMPAVGSSSSSTLRLEHERERDVEQLLVAMRQRRRECGCACWRGRAAPWRIRRGRGVSASGKRRCSMPADGADRRRTAASMVSSTVSEGKMLATWKARPMPRRTMSGATRPADDRRRRAGCGR